MFPDTALLRQYSYPYYLTGLLCPAALRARLFALAALEAELCTIPAKTSEAMLGVLRLQWWQQELKRTLTSDPPSNHPLLQHLLSLHHTHPFDPEALHHLIQAHALWLEEAPPSEEALLAYTDHVDATLLRQALAPLGEGSAALEPLLMPISRAIGVLRITAKLDPSPTWTEQIQQATETVTQARTHLRAKALSPAQKPAYQLLIRLHRLATWSVKQASANQHPPHIAPLTTRGFLHVLTGV